MTSASDLVAETRQHLLHGTREGINKLATTLDADDTDVVLTYDLRGVQEGAVISLGLERMYVWSSTVSSKTASVERGWDGTIAVAHTAGEIVRVNSRFDDFAIFRALNEDILDLSSPENGLFQVTSLDLTYATTTYGYDLNASMIGAPLLVEAEYPGGTGNWSRLSGWQFNPNADSTDFPSGKSLHLLGDQGSPGRTVRVVYAAAFETFLDLTDDTEDIGLPDTCADIPPLGAAARLLAGRASRRSDLDAQGSTRRSEEVSTNDALASPRGLLAQRQMRINSEAARLAALYPVLL